MKRIPKKDYNSFRETLFIMQKGKCAICGESIILENKRRFHLERLLVQKRNL